MLRIHHLEEIQRLLLRIPALIAELDQHAVDLSSKVKVWLTDAEQVLKRLGLSMAGEVAALRGLVLSAERGSPPLGVVIHGRITPRRIKEVSCATIISRASDLIASAIRSRAAQIEDGERLARQMLAIASQKGMHLPLLAGSDKPLALKGLWHTLSSDPDLASGARHLAGLAGEEDALLLIERAILSP